jgi:hypothetical protein
MGKTPIYNLGYLEPNQDLSDELDLDELRFRAIESQTYSLYQIFKNGIIEDESNNYISWQIDTIANDYQNVLVSIGRGHVSWKAAETTVERTVALPVLPTGLTNVKIYLYAVQNDNTPVTKDIDFISSLTEIVDVNNYIALGGVNIDLTTSPYTITVFTDGRQIISLFASISDIINKHKHIGGAANPSPIDLSKHVRGKLSGEYIENLDISTVTKGTLDAARLPQIDHTTLSNIGTLSHSQIDDLLASLLRDDNTYRLSDLSIANRLQTLSALKKSSSTYRYIDTTQINTLMYVPGIWPNEYSNSSVGNTANFAVKSVSNVTLATIGDTGPYNSSTNFIRATSSDNVYANTITYTSKRDFVNAEDFATANNLSEFLYNIKISGTSYDSEDGQFTIDTPLNFSSIEQPISDVFNTSLNWYHGYINTKTLVDNTFKLDTRLYAFKTFQAQAWDGVTNIGIGFSTANPEALSHIGDIYMYLILPSNLEGTGGATKVTFSTAEVFPTTAPSTIITTLPYRIFREYTGTGATNPDLGTSVYTNVALSNFISSQYRTSILGFGFYWSTLNGWNPEKEIYFSLQTPADDKVNPDPYNYDELQAARKSSASNATASTFIWNESLHSKDGKFLVRFDTGNTSTQFNLIQWDVTEETNSRYNISTRTDITSSTFKDLTNISSGVDFVSGSPAYGSDTGRYLDLLFSLNSDVTRVYAPIIKKFIVTYTTVGTGISKNWNTRISDIANNQLGWITENYSSNNVGYGVTYFDSGSNVPKNSLYISSTTDIGNWLFLRNDSAVSAYSNNTETTLEDGIDTGSLKNYLSPVQVFNKSATYGFNKPKDFFTTSSDSRLYSDTENDSIVMFNSSGAITKLIQGNIRLKLLSRDFVALSASFNPLVKKIWVAFSQNISSTIDKSKINIKYTSNGKSYIIDLNDSRIDTTGTGLFTPLVGNKSATLQILLNDELNTILENATNKKITFDSGSVSNDTTSDNTSISGTGTGTGADTAGGTVTTGTTGNTVTTTGNTGSSTSSTGTTCKVVDYLNILDVTNYNGAGTCITGLLTHVSSLVSSTDFNGDGIIPTDALLGPNNQKTFVSLDIIQGPIYFDNIYNPISVQVNSANQWIIAQPFVNSIIAYNNDDENSVDWVITNSVVEFLDTKLGSAYELSNSNILIGASLLSSTDNGKMIIINRKANNSIVTKLVFPEVDVVKALPGPNDELFYVLLDDVTNDGLNTKLQLVNTQGKTISKWPNNSSNNEIANPITHPKGLRILPNSDVLVSE